MPGRPATESVEAPENKHIQIWRFVDFSKFVSMLDSSGLFFSRVSNFDDPFEGLITFPDFEEYRTPHNEKNVPKEMSSLEFMKQEVEWFKHWTMVNCWHESEHESDFMWRLYAGGSNTVAIQSKFSLLVKCLPEYVVVGKVKYIDYEKDNIPFKCFVDRFFHKRKSFAPEREIRACHTDWTSGLQHGDGDIVVTMPSDLVSRPKDRGMLFTVDLDLLINKIYVAPFAPDYFYNLVKSVVKKYGVNKEVIKSSLYTKPSY